MATGQRQTSPIAEDGDRVPYVDAEPQQGEPFNPMMSKLAGRPDAVIAGNPERPDFKTGGQALPINADFLVRCIDTLESAFEQLRQHEPSDTLYDIFRAAAVKEFEIILEQCGSLLRRRLRPYFASKRQAGRLTFKDVFRYAAKHGLISVSTSERWFV